MPTGGTLGELRMAHQDGVDLQRCDVHPAADDQVLRPPGDGNEPLGIEHAEVAGPHPVGEPVRPQGPGTSRPVRRCRRRSGGRGSRPRPACRAGRGGRRHRGSRTPCAWPAGRPCRPGGRRRRVAAQPAAFGSTVELEQTDAVDVLEPAPPVGRQRRGARGHQAQTVQPAGADFDRPVEQHVDHRSAPRRQR